MEGLKMVHQMRYKNVVIHSNYLINISMINGINDIMDETHSINMFILAISSHFF